MLKKKSRNVPKINFMETMFSGNAKSESIFVSSSIISCRKCKQASSLKKKIYTLVVTFKNTLSDEILQSLFAGISL